MTFVPPPKGRSYVDPIFGCTVTRLTDVSSEVPAGSQFLSIHHAYSTLSPMNSDDSMILVGDLWGRWFVIGMTGNQITLPGRWPSPGPIGSPVWDLVNPNVLYFTPAGSHELDKAAVNKGTGSVAASKIHLFSEYDSVAMVDAPDVSQDNTSVLLVGHNSNNTLDVFVYGCSSASTSIERCDSSHLAKSKVYTTECTASAPLSSQPGCLHKVQFTSNKDVYITFNSDGGPIGTESGGEVWDGSALHCVQPMNGAATCGSNHADTGNDLSGDPILVEDRADKHMDPCPRKYGNTLVNLKNLFSPKLVCLNDKSGSAAVHPHFSFRGGPDQPWAVVSYFDSRTPSPEWFNTSANFDAPTTSNWAFLEDEITTVRVDADNNPLFVYRLAHARSRSNVNYWAQPHASISHDGKYVVFGSNMAFPNGCPSSVPDPTDCSDVYVLKIRN